MRPVGHFLGGLSGREKISIWQMSICQANEPRRSPCSWYLKRQRDPTLQSMQQGIEINGKSAIIISNLYTAFRWSRREALSKAENRIEFSAPQPRARHRRTETACSKDCLHAL